jgi:hypothetical protein
MSFNQFEPAKLAEAVTYVQGLPGYRFTGEHVAANKVHAAMGEVIVQVHSASPDVLERLVEILSPDHFSIEGVRTPSPIAELDFSLVASFD